jgi:acyl-CoA synthetase (AMP-forming)/AMP-acid ligase II
MPELDWLLNDAIPCPAYPYSRTYDDGKSDPCLVIQVPSSSGLPKPVVWTQRAFTAVHSRLSVPAADAARLRQSGALSSSPRVLSAIPVFHGTGIISGIRKVCFNNAILVLSPGTCTADVFAQVLDTVHIDSADSTPVTLEEIARRPDILARVAARRLQHITYVRGECHTAKRDFSNHR